MCGVSHGPHTALHRGSRGFAHPDPVHLALLANGTTTRMGAWEGGALPALPAAACVQWGNRVRPPPLWSCGVLFWAPLPP